MSWIKVGLDIRPDNTHKILHSKNNTILLGRFLLTIRYSVGYPVWAELSGIWLDIQKLAIFVFGPTPMLFNIECFKNVATLYGTSTRETSRSCWYPAFISPDQARAAPTGTSINVLNLFNYFPIFFFIKSCKYFYLAIAKNNPKSSFLSEISRMWFETVFLHLA